MKKFFVFAVICGMFLLIGLLPYHTNAQKAEPRKRGLEVEINVNNDAELAINRPTV